MHEGSSEPHEFVAEGREEAIAKACQYFGLDSDALKIAEFPAGDDFLGPVHCHGVLEGVSYHEGAIDRPGQSRELNAFRARAGHRLFDEHMLTGQQTLLDELKVGGDRGGDGDGVNVGIVDHVINPRCGRDVRI